MWLIALAVPLLLISAVLSAFMAESYHKSNDAVPAVLARHESLFSFFEVLFFAGGIALVVAAVGWWGLFSIAAYWVLVVLVLMPVGTGRFLIPLFERSRFGQSPALGAAGAGETAAGEENPLDQPPDIVLQHRRETHPLLDDLTVEDLLAIRETFKSDPRIKARIDEMLKEKNSHTL